MKDWLVSELLEPVDAEQERLRNPPPPPPQRRKTALEDLAAAVRVTGWPV